MDPVTPAVADIGMCYAIGPHGGFCIYFGEHSAHSDGRLHWPKESDPVNNPLHYKGNGMETIDVIESFDLGFHLGAAVKYILRAGKKGDAVEDLRKALWFIERDIKRRTK